MSTNSSPVYQIKHGLNKYNQNLITHTKLRYINILFHSKLTFHLLILQSLRFLNISTGSIADLTLKDSKYFHVGIHQSQSITVERLKISAPGDSKNTDGVHISISNNITLNSLSIGTGDDCVSIGQGSVNITISNVICGPGHGIR